MIEAAPAKVNLALHVRRRRDDGYHDLETIFVFTEFGDTLRVSAERALTLDITGPLADAVAEGDNLVLRAARALARTAGIAANAALVLDKHIPVAAGLGGGSADAAAALRLLNRFWGLDWSLERLAMIGAKLGADVSACVYGVTMVGEGAGETLRAVDLGVAGTPILLVNPRVAVPTGPVFAAWDGVDRGPLDPAAWLSARNDLAAPALRLAPVIGDVLAALTASGAHVARMSGSGATCFALYADATARDEANAAVQDAQPGWWMLATTLR